MKPTVLFLIFSVVVVIAEAQSVSCGPGTFRQNDKCIPCPAGTHQFRTNQLTCISCPAGTFNGFRGAQGPDLCRSCPAGTFSTSGSASCTPCPAGSDSREGFSQCLACARGEAISFSGEFCAQCTAGSYWKSRSEGCVACPRGFSSPPGSTSADACFDCPPGSEALGPSVCRLCDFRRFRRAGMETCEFCPLGTFSIIRGATECQLCPAGTFKSSQITTRCATCLAGTTSQPGARTCRPADGSACPQGQFEDATGNCIACGPGEYRNTSTNLCTKCELDTEFSPGGLVTSCQPCGRLAVRTFNGDGCICRDGKQFAADSVSCELCTPGTEGTCPLRLGEMCTPCRIGKFNNIFGATECEDCPLGFTTLERGATKCVKCPDGLIPRTIESPGSEPCVLPQTNCPAGFERVLNRNPPGFIRSCRRIAMPTPSSSPSSVPLPKLCIGRCYEGRRITRCRWRTGNKCRITFVDRQCDGRKFLTCVQKERTVPRNCMDACMALPFWRKKKLEQQQN